MIVRRFSRISIKYKLIGMTVGLAAAIGIGMTTASYVTASGEFKKASENALKGIAEARKTELQTFLTSISRDLHLTANHPFTHQALSDFDTTLLGRNDAELKALQSAYVADNPSPKGDRHKLDRASGSQPYHDAHALYHPWFRELMETQGYSDVYLFNTLGDLVYTASKAEDFATNFAKGSSSWSNSELGHAFRAANQMAEGQQIFRDFKTYGASQGDPVSFVAQPLFIQDQRVGVIGFQLPLRQLNQIMASVEGLGETGQVVLVGEDRFLRNDSVRTDANDSLSAQLDNPLLAGVFEGQQLAFSGMGFGGHTSLSYATPLSFMGTTWAVVATQDQAEIDKPLIKVETAMAITGFVLTLLALGVAYALSRSLTLPMSRLSKVVKEISEGKTDCEIPSLKRTDEIGEMAMAIEILREAYDERRRLEETVSSERDLERSRQDFLEGVIASFRRDISVVMQRLQGGTEVLKITSESLQTSSDDASVEATKSREASSQSSENVRAVSEAASELFSSSQDISSQANEAANYVSEANAVAEATNAEVGRLAELSESIGEVVGLIRAVADQTNLLALNATIEAARAGEAGRGFAVVAQEVKTLANQTASATAKIEDQILQVQSSTKAAVTSIGSISTFIDQINDITFHISAAIDEQAIATNQISMNIDEAAAGTAASADCSDRVLETVDDANSEAGTVLAVSSEMNEVAEELSSAVERFLDMVATDLNDRRDASRTNDGRSAIAEVNGVEYECVINDISDTGLQLVGLPELDRGCILTVTANNGDIWRAQVAWFSQGRVGCAFVQEDAAVAA